MNLADKQNKKIFLQALNGEETKKVPCWFMRQAGRYLPEYRELRKQAGGFLNLVYNPELASEVTMQPIRRYGMDAAILFSDILVIPQALGQSLKFETGEGPKLDPLIIEEDFKKLNLENIEQTLNPIYETVRLTRQKLSSESHHQTALIGFAGSPWTVACYMVEGGGSKTFEATKKWAYQNPESFQKLIQILVSASSHYLIKQIEAGAEAIQLFDSWSGVLDSYNFNRWVVKPTQAIVSQVKERYPDIPIIGFPRDAGQKSVTYAQNTGISAIGIDYSLDPTWARDNLQNLIPVQGNLDPVSLLAGGDILEKSAQNILENLADKPFIFNLGHGVIKETPPENLARLIQIIHEYKK